MYSARIQLQSQPPVKAKDHENGNYDLKMSRDKKWLDT